MSKYDQWARRSIPCLLLLALIATALPALAQRGASGLPAGPGNPLSMSQPVAVFDANGTKVGNVIGTTRFGSAAGITFTGFALEQFTIPIVAVNVSGALFGLAVEPARLSAGVLLFGSPNCSGTPFLLFGGVTVLPVTAVTPPGSTLWAPAPAGTPASVSINSHLTRDGQCELLLGTTLLVVPAAAVIDLDTQFTGPFTIH